MDTVTTRAPDLVEVICVDWEGARKAQLENVPRTSTVGQIVGEAVANLGLPLQHLYQAVFQGRELDPAQTLEELGIETDVQFDLAPVVSAGSGFRIKKAGFRIKKARFPIEKTGIRVNG